MEYVMSVLIRFLITIVLFTGSYSAYSVQFNEIFEGKRPGTSGERYSVITNGKRYVFYGKHHLYALEDNGTGWNQQYLIDDTDGVGDFVSSALDGAGNIHLVYRNNNTKALKYATNKSGSWVNTIAHNGDTAWAKSSIVVDSTNKVHIFFLNNNTIYHTYQSGDTWLTETVASNATHLSADIATDNIVHIAFLSSDKTKLNYAYKSINSVETWTEITLFTAVTGSFNEIAFDVAGNYTLGEKAIAVYLSTGKAI